MTEAERNLQNMISILNSPEMYPDVSATAMFFAQVFVVVGMLIALVGIVILMVIMARTAIDLLYINLRGFGFASKMQSWTTFSGNDADSKVTDSWSYIKHQAWKVVISLAVVAIMISGQALPLAGQLAGVVGVAINKVVGLDPAGALDSLTGQDLRNALNRFSDEGLYKAYESQTNRLVKAYNTITQAGGWSEATFAQKAEYNTSRSNMIEIVNIIQSKPEDIKKMMGDITRHAPYMNLDALPVETAP